MWIYVIHCLHCKSTAVNTNDIHSGDGDGGGVPPQREQMNVSKTQIADAVVLHDTPYLVYGVCVCANRNQIRKTIRF